MNMPAQSIAIAPPNPPRKRAITFPPRRGRVKAQIFEGLAAEISSLASRTGKAFARLKRGGDSASTSTSTSTFTSPPPSLYASDGYPDHA